MDFPTWTVEMIRALAWPAVATFFLWKYRQPVGEALKTLASLKLPGGVEMTFERQIRAAERVAQDIEPPKEPIAKVNDPETARLLKMATESPTGAIIESWKLVEAAARKTAELSGISMQTDTLRPYFNLQSFLQTNDLLPPAEIETFRELRLIRNRVAHASDHEVTTESALAYVRLADRLVDAIESLRRP